MDTVIACKYDNGTLMAVETTVNRSIFKMKFNEDKTFKLGDRCLMVLAGDIADRAHFGSFIQRNIDFNRFKNNGRQSSVRSSAEFVRGELAKAIRESQKQVSPIIIGYDERKQAQLYWLDYLGTIAEVNHASQGYCSYFVSSILNHEWRNNLKLEEAVKLLERCANQVKGRIIIDQLNFDYWVVDKDGIRKLNKE